MDDEPVTRITLAGHLRRWGYRVLVAEDGLEARDLLVQHPEIRLLITDWMMPGMDGLELCRRAREMSRPRYLHILVLTVRSEKSGTVEAIAAGADAFLMKPVNASDLQAQVRVARRILDLDELNSRRIEELDAINRRIQRDMEAAARVQNSFLPERVVSLPRIRCASVFQSSEHVAGDMFNVLCLDEDRVAAYVLDVSGHGTQAALLSVSVQLLLESLAHEGSRRSASADGEGVCLEDPQAVLEMLNRRFPVMHQSNQYFTMIYGVLDARRRTFEYARAGHTWPVLVTSQGTRLMEESAGAALGVFSEIHARAATQEMAPGDVILLYSDGVTEARSSSDRLEEFGSDRLLETLDRSRGQGVEAVVDRLFEAVQDYTGPYQTHDDLTILGLELLKD